nr:plasmid recombination protein [Tabrizicola sp. TH137]
MICLRVRPLRKWADVAAATEHGRRVRKAAHIDLTRSQMNEHYVFDPDAVQLERCETPADITRCLRARAGELGAKWHKSAIVATEIMFIASKSFFTRSDGTVDTALANDWSDACLRAWERLFPGQSVAARLDLDETTPHLSVFFLPLHERRYRSQSRVLRQPERTRLKVSHNKAFGDVKGPDILAMLQSWLAAEMQAAGFDLVRGQRVDETGNGNKTPAAGRRALAAARQLAEDIEEDALAKAAERFEDTELRINQRLREVQAQVVDAKQKIMARHEKNQKNADELRRFRQELVRGFEDLQRDREELLDQIRILDRVMRDIARQLGVEATGSFQKRLRAISEALEDRQSGGGPAYRPS